MTAVAEATVKPTKLQQLKFHVMNGITGIAFLSVWQAKSVTGVMIGLVIGVIVMLVVHRLKRRGMPQAGEERLRVGPIHPVAPESKVGFYGVGILLFVLLAISMLFIPDFRRLVRIGMACICAGLGGAFLALINPRLRKTSLTLLALTMLIGGTLIAVDAVTRFQEGGDDAILQTVKTGILAAVTLPTGLIMTRGIIRGEKQEQTPLFDNGMYTQWGFMPWSVLSLSLVESEGEHRLDATAHNGWSLQMSVADDQIDAIRALIADIRSGDQDS